MAGFSFSSSGATPQSPTGSMPNMSGGTPQGRALNGAASPPLIPLVPPTHLNIKSHTITHPDGTSVVQTYHNPADQKAKTPGLLGKSDKTPQPTAQAVPMPEIRYENGKHHVPFKKADGTVGYTDAGGNIS